MVFTKEDRILIKVLRQSMGYSDGCWSNFLTRTGLVQHWTDFCGRVTLQGLHSANRKSGSSRERTVCTRDMQMSVQMATTLSINRNWWYCVRTAKATFILETSVFEFHFLNSCCSKTVWWILLKFATFAPER